MTVRNTTTVLVLVKAAPQPSSTYGETVCVAGLEGPAERRAGCVCTQSHSGTSTVNGSFASTTSLK